MSAVRASSAYKIVTNRPSFNAELLEGLEEKIKIKIPTYTRAELSVYITTKGIMTDAQAIVKQLENQRLCIEDPLPDGAKTYLEELWLQENGFYEFSLRENAFQLQKGKICEDDAIAILDKILFSVKTLYKNTKRVVKDFLTGECDIEYETTIRDTKCPETWKTFRDKDSIIPVYYWQLIAYCYLYDKTEAWLDYVLMPTPIELITFETRNFTEGELERWQTTQLKIEALPYEQRVKSFKLECNLQEEIEFLKSRLNKAKEYYNTLDLAKCLKLNGQTVQ